MKKQIILFFILSTFFDLLAQKPLGTWTSYLPYGNASKLALADNRIYCSTNGGAFYYNKLDNSLHKISREDGLSDTEITSLAYSQETKTLVITYSNANIDLIHENKIFNIPDIKNKQVLGDKAVYSIYNHNDKAWLGCGFGIVLVDLSRHEIKETYYIAEGGTQVKVNGITILNNKIFAATEKGVYTADITNPNLIDFNSWSIIPGIPAGRYNAIVTAGNKVYANEKFEGTDDQLFFYENGSWFVFPSFTSSDILALASVDNSLLITSLYKVSLVNPQGGIMKEYGGLSPRCAFIDEQNIWWVADGVEGLLKIENDIHTPLKPDGPAGINAVSMESDGGQLIVVPGGVSSSWNNLYRAPEVYRYFDNSWENWKGEIGMDLFRIAFDPLDPSHYFIGCWGTGLLEFREGVLINHFDTENSTLQTIIPGTYMRLGGIAFDKDQNLWMNNTGVAEPLSVYKKDGSWKSFKIPAIAGFPALGDMIYTFDGSLWMILPRGNGLFVYNPNNTPDNESDDVQKKLSVVDDLGKVISNDVYSIAEDRQGNIWVGTNKGIIIYYTPSRVFEGNGFYAHTPIVPRNDGSNLGDPLMGTETVTAILVDGANRKWLGTKSGGVFLVSGDGLKQIRSFNEDNSPLLSNSINDIAINDKTGEVFFATGKGIISYVSDATTPSAAFEDVYVYPNPVRENYFGNIVIAGLIEDAYVKITDLNGNLVHETRSIGGNALWDGKNLLGDRVSTGVYLVFCTNEDGSLTHVTKLLFIH